MQKVWNIGNTTVRNPLRIENALKVFYEEGFSGNAKGSILEAKLHEKMKEREVLYYDGEPSDWNGRKWRASFYQLGFISDEDYKIDNSKKTVKEIFKSIKLPQITSSYELTPAGKKLINCETVSEIEEVYLRQFSCYEIPTTLENNFEGGNMKPFILLLEILYNLQKLGHIGINKLETEIFIQKFRNHDKELSNTIVREIISFRKQINSVTPKEKKRIIDKYLNDLYLEVDLKIKSRSIKDYADTTFRYFSLSGLFTHIEDRIIIRQNKFEFVKELLKGELNFIYKYNPLKYLSFYYNNSYFLPIDNKQVALYEIEQLKKNIRNSNHPLFDKINNISNDTTVSEINKIRLELIEYNSWEREEDYAKEQQFDDAINDTLNYLRKLSGDNSVNIDIDDKPAYLEWAVWRSFLAINNIVVPVHKTRRFSVDQDFKPRNTAPGGGSDLLFEFENYILVVEVTLTISSRQMAVESEPVRRHVVQYKELYPNKDVYCIFLAPNVDNNVVETFRYGVWYRNDQDIYVDIVPMTLKGFTSLIETFLISKYNNNDFKALIEKCLMSRTLKAPLWQDKISNEILNWNKKFSNLN